MRKSKEKNTLLDRDGCKLNSNKRFLTTIERNPSLKNREKKKKFTHLYKLERY